MKKVDTLAAHSLLSIARQREGFDADCCRLVLEHMDTTSALQAALHKTLGNYQLSDLQFAVLMVLFTLDPEPLGAAELAIHTGVSRSAMTEALDHLEARELVSRTRDNGDRRIISVRLLDAGRTLIEPATLHLLRTLTGITRFVTPEARDHLRGGYALLQEGSAGFQT